MSVIWGMPYLLIKVAVEDGVPPAFVAWSRLALGAVILLALAAHAGLLATLRGRWRWLALFAAVEMAIPFPLLAAGEQRVSSSVAAIVIATVPLVVALLAMRFDAAERASGMRLVGLLIGLGGVVALVGIDVAGRTDELVGVALIVIVVVCYSIGPLVLKHRLADLDPRAQMGGSLAVATLLLTPAALVAPPGSAPSADAWLALALLGVLCTALAFVVFNVLISEVGPGRALVITYINPVVAVALGVTILGERPGVGAVAGLLLILAGSWLSTDGRLPPGLTWRRAGTPDHRPRGVRAAGRLRR